MHLRIILFVIGAVLGSGIFILPAALSRIGFNAIYGFLFTNIVFIFLGYLFISDKNISNISLITEAFGKKVAFFFSWSYWVLSWSSTIILINELFIYLSSCWSFLNAYTIVFKILIVIFFVIINSFSLKITTMIESFLVLFKILPLIIIPIVVILNTNIYNIINYDWSFNLSNTMKAIPISIWTFFGIEVAAVIGKKIDQKQIISSSLIGYFILSIIYILNYIAVFTFFYNKPISFTCYTEIIYDLFGIQAQKLFNLMISLLLIGSINSWIVFAGFLGYDNAKIGFMPAKFLCTNKNQIPYVSILLSAIGLFPLIILSNNNDIRIFLLDSIDKACIGILLYYAIFSITFFRKNKKILGLIVGIILLIIFIYQLILNMKLLIILTVVLLTGIPVYLYQRQKGFINDK